MLAAKHQSYRQPALKEAKAFDKANKQQDDVIMVDAVIGHMSEEDARVPFKPSSA